jgi:hypothetical protein
MHGKRGYETDGRESIVSTTSKYEKTRFLLKTPCLDKPNLLRIRDGSEALLGLVRTLQSG